MSISFDFFDFDYPVQDALGTLRWDIRDGFKSDFDAPTVTTYQLMQTNPACKRQPKRCSWMVELMMHLGDVYSVQLYCPESIDSLGDFLAVHGLWNGEAA